MDTFETIRTMLAVRSYRSEPVPDDVVQRIVEAGRLTGSSRNLQPWAFIVVRDRETLRELGRLASTGPYTADAAFAIAVAVERASPYGISDGSRAIQSMMLAAWSEGVGSNWVGFGNLPDVEKALGVPPDHLILGLIPFGYPAARIGRGRKNRKPLAEIAHDGRWGSPFSG